VSGEVWEELVAEASSAEIEAMKLEQDGELVLAARTFERVVAKLLQAASSAPEDHAIKSLLEARAKALLQHSALLATPPDGDSASGTGAAFEGRGGKDQLREVKLVAEGLLASTLASSVGSNISSTVLRRRLEDMGMAAAIGGSLGLVILGPVAALSVGAGMAYATTREDAVGSAARSASAAGVRAAKRAADSSMKVMDSAMDTSRHHLQNRLAVASPSSNPWLHKHQSECKRLLSAIDSVQESMPSRKRSLEAKNMRERFPDRVPVFCVAVPGSGMAQLERSKLLVSGSMRLGEFKYIVHRQVARAEQQERTGERTIYLFVGGTSPQTSRTMADLYDRHRGEDGFLHVLYSAENTLG